jgi:hypothetical protein
MRTSEARMALPVGETEGQSARANQREGDHTRLHESSRKIGETRLFGDASLVRREGRRP